MGNRLNVDNTNMDSKYYPYNKKKGGIDAYSRTKTTSGSNNATSGNITRSTNHISTN